MKNFLLLLILATSIISCSQKEELEIVTPTFDLYGTSELTMINNSTDSTKIGMVNYPRIIGGVQEFDTTISTNDSVSFEVKTQGYSYFTLAVNDYYYRVFSSPTSIVYAEITSDSTMLFTGEFDSINNYLAKNSGSYYSTNESLMELINLTQNAASYEDLIHKNDKIILKHQMELEKYKSILPDWYVDIESKRLSVLGASYKLNSLSYRKRMLQIEDEIPPHYVDSIVKNIPYQDERLLGFSVFSHFMSDYSSQSFNPLNDTSANYLKERYTDSLYNHTAHFVPIPFGDYALTSSLNRRLMMHPDGFKPEWIELLSDTVYKNFLRKKLNRGAALPKGAEAPNFNVLDIDSNLFYFSGIKDTVVLINFWATYCTPCIYNFPRENELAIQYQNKPVKIINMCIESDFDMFKVYVEMHKL